MLASFKTVITMQVNRFLRSLKVTFCPKFETHFQFWFRISWFAIGDTNHIRKVLCKLGFVTVIPEKLHWVVVGTMGNLTDHYSFCLKEIGHMVFKICLFLVSLYYIVFANILMRLMREIGEICSLTLIFGNILPIFYA